MCLTFRIPTVPKNTIAYDTHTTVIKRSIGQISSAYSLLWVRPMGKVITAETITAFQPQNVSQASLFENKAV